MKNRLCEICKTYKNEYNQIFSYISPADNAERFTEENQTLNFYNAVRKAFANDDVVAWFEYPWKPAEKSPPKRFDAIILIKEKETDKTILFIVEAKCLRHAKKYVALTNDFLRTIRKNENNDNFENKIKIHAKAPDEVYTVILADYWNKNDLESNDNWEDTFKKCDKDKINNYIEIVENNLKLDLIEKPFWKSMSLKIKDSNNYHLLTMIAKIKEPEKIYQFMYN